MILGVVMEDYYIKLTAWGSIVVAGATTVLTVIGIVKFWKWYKNQVKEATVEAVKDVVAVSIRDGINDFHAAEEIRRKLRLEGYNKDFNHLKETSEKNTKMLVKSILSINDLISGKEGVQAQVIELRAQFEGMKNKCHEIQENKKAI